MSMSYSEEQIVDILAERFDGITISIQRKQRIWLESPRQGFIELLTFIHDELGFDALCTVTCLDNGDEFQLIYHLAHACGIVLNARVSAPADNPVFDTATDIYKGGVLYELEARNLFGLTILGIPDDIAYPLPDNWPEGQYPLRKSWTLPVADEPSEDGAADGGATGEPGKVGKADDGETSSDKEGGNG